MTQLRNVGYFVLIFNTALCVADKAFSDPPAVLTKSQMLDEVVATRARCVDLEVAYNQYLLTDSAVSTVNFSRHRVILSDPDRLIDWEYTLSGQAPTVPHRRITYSSGDRLLYYTGSTRTAAIGSSFPETFENSLQGTAFFDFNLMNPPRADGIGVNDQSLVSLLKYSGSRVRSELEELNGVFCHVVDVPFDPDSPDGPVVMTAWLDHDRGCVPLRQVFYTNRMDGSSLMEFVADEVCAPAEGFWVVASGTKTVYASGVSKEHVSELVYTYEIARDADQMLSFSVSDGRVPHDFSIATILPMGTYLNDMDSGQSVLVSSNRSSEMAESLVAASGLDTSIFQSSGSTAAPVSRGDLIHTDASSVGLTTVPRKGQTLAILWGCMAGLSAALCIRPWMVAPE